MMRPASSTGSMGKAVRRRLSLPKSTHVMASATDDLPRPLAPEILTDRPSRLASKLTSPRKLRMRIFLNLISIIFLMLGWLV